MDVHNPSIKVIIQDQEIPHSIIDGGSGVNVINKMTTNYRVGSKSAKTGCRLTYERCNILNRQKNIEDKNKQNVTETQDIFNVETLIAKNHRTPQTPNCFTIKEEIQGDS